MTYGELINSLMLMFGDEKGIVHGKPVRLIYDIGREAEKVGMDTNIDEISFNVMLKSYDMYDEYYEMAGKK